MKPEAAIDSWRDWVCDLSSRPQIINTLGGGRSNRSLLLEADGLQMVLRINASGAALPTSGRRAEAAVWQAAAGQEIAPELLFVDLNRDYLVSRYITDALPVKPQQDQRVIAQAFTLLDACHQLDVEMPAIDYLAHVHHYWQLIDQHGLNTSPTLRARRRPMQQLLEDLVSSGAPLGVCHHDLVVENFVGSPEKLYLIDWEYAARGLQVMDYAALGVEWGIDDAVIVERSGIEPELLAMGREVYSYLCQLWEVISLNGA